MFWVQGYMFQKFSVKFFFFLKFFPCKNSVPALNPDHTSLRLHAKKCLWQLSSQARKCLGREDAWHVMCVQAAMCRESPGRKAWMQKAHLSRRPNWIMSWKRESKKFPDQWLEFSIGLHFIEWFFFSPKKVSTKLAFNGSQNTSSEVSFDKER